MGPNEKDFAAEIFVGVGEAALLGAQKAMIARSSFNLMDMT
jgi:hypothetical protein